MENMFSAFSKITDAFNGKKKVPKSLEECRTIDPTVSALNRWAVTANWVCIAVAILVCLVGASMASKADEFSVFLPFGLVGWIVLAVGDFFSNLIRGLASIVYNTGITANIALMNANQEEDPVGQEPKKVVKQNVSHNSVFGSVPAKTEEEPSRPPVHIKQTSKEVSKLEDALYE